MKYFKYGHGKWYPYNLAGIIKYEAGYFKKRFSLFANSIYKEWLKYKNNND